MTDKDKAFQFVGWNAAATSGEIYGRDYYGDGDSLATAESVPPEADGLVEVRISKKAHPLQAVRLLEKVAKQYLEDMEQEGPQTKQSR